MDDENVLKLIVVTITHTCEYTNYHETVHFKWVNSMVCESYVNKAIFEITSLYLWSFPQMQKISNTKNKWKSLGEESG